MGYVAVGWVMQEWGRVGHAGVGWLMQWWGRLCRGGVCYVGMGCVIQGEVGSYLSDK